MNGLLKLAIEGHGGLRRWEQLSRFRVAASITGAIWALKGQPGLLDGVVLAGETRDQRLTINPDAIVAHTRQQTYYFDEDGLLRRLDYSVDILGGGPAVNYPSGYREFDGIMVPTRRRIYVRRPDGTPVPGPVSVAVDVTNAAFS